MSGAHLGLPVLDAHQHFWDPVRNYHPWLRDEPPLAFRYGRYDALKRPYLPADYRADAAGFDVAGTVYVETEWDPGDPLGETRWVHALAEREGLPSAVVAQAWLDRDDAPELIAAQAAFPLVRGVRHKPAVAHSPHAPAPGPRGSMSDERWRRGFAALERHGLVFDLQAPWWHLPEAARLAADFPGITIVLDHAGLPPVDRGEAGLSRWRDAVAALAERPNACVKISGLGQPGRPWTVEANRRVVLDLLELFGAERCLLASNFPVDRLCATFAEIYHGLAEITAHLPAADRRRLFHDNARRVYRIDGPATGPASGAAGAGP